MTKTTYWVYFYYKETDSWGRVKIAVGSEVDLALAGALGEKYDELRKFYKLKKD